MASSQGGMDQGMQQLSVFSDYNNTDHGNGFLIESNVFQEQLIGPGDVTEVWFFSWDAKKGNIEGNSTALGFIKTLDPNNGFVTTNFITEDMTNTPTTWTTYSLSITIDDTLPGQILQIGFNNTTTYYQGSGVFYDNINFAIEGSVPTTDTSVGSLKTQFK